MRVPARLYLGKEGQLAYVLYNKYGDVYSAPPQPLREKSRHAIHAKYGFGGQRQSLDVYLFSGTMHELINYLSLNKKRYAPANIDISFVDKRNEIEYQAINDLKHSALEEQILSCIRQDVLNYCENPAHLNVKPKITHSQEITPITKAVIRSRTNYFSLTGKQDHIPPCAFDRNLDFEGDCVSAFIPGKAAHFDGHIFVGYYIDKSSKCHYCYAKRARIIFPKTMYSVDEDDLVEEILAGKIVIGKDKTKHTEPIQTIRLGKLTEPGHAFTLDSLVATANALIRTDRRGIMPTKFLEYDKSLAKKLNEAKISVLFSNGWDELEPGACAYGFANEHRRENAVKYREAGVNASLYFQIDAVHEPGPREHAIIAFIKHHKLPAQLLPMRINDDEVAQVITGMSRESLKGSSAQIDIMHQFDKNHRNGGYINTGSNSLTAEEIHPFWLKLIEDNKGLIRMCHHNRHITWCGSCHLDTRDGLITNTKKVVVEYTKKFKSKKGEQKQRKLIFN